MSVDPKTVTGARLINPQSLNFYEYGGNNPELNIDPDGAEEVRVATYTLTLYTQVGDTVSPMDMAYALAGTYAGGGPQSRPYMKSTAIGQFQFQAQDKDNDLGAISAWSPFKGMGNYLVSFTRMAVDVDFREDPGAGVTATITLRESHEPIASFPTRGLVIPRPTGLPTAEVTGFSASLRTLAPDRLLALHVELERQLSLHPNNIILAELQYAVELEATRRAKEKKKREARKGGGYAPPSGLDLPSNQSGFGVGP